MVENNCICFSDVYKRFADKEVLKGLNFKVKKGEIVAILGHNGAGKTTTLRIIQGLMSRDKGMIKVFGTDPSSADEKIRQMTGVLSDNTGLYESLTVYDNLKFFSDIYGCEDTFFEEQIDLLLKEFHMFDYKNKVIKDFSMGMKKKIAIIRTIFHNPKLVLMDEPMNGLDPVSREVLYQTIRSMREELGTTFVITTHDLDAVPKFCDSIIIIKDGKNVLERSLGMDQFNDIVETYIKLYDHHKGYDETIDNIFKLYYPNKRWKIEEDTLVIEDVDDEIVASIVQMMIYNDIKICEITRKEFDLEKLYIDIDREGVEKWGR